MRYVRRPDELPDLFRRYAAPKFLQARTLSIVFETDPEAIAAVLPPPLEPDGSSLASVGVACFGASNCVGPFDGGSLNVRARYGDVAGNYCVTMPMSTDTAIVFGRELYGEPKKQARVALVREGSHVRGTVERFGITYVTIEADLDEVRTPGEAQGSTFHVKFTPRCDGQGLDGDPLLIQVSSRIITTRLERGAGTIRFQESPYDPVIDFPVRRIVGATYTEGETHTSARVLARLDAERFLPYAFGKMDPMERYVEPAAEPAAIA
jgi:acetoacetate decarboxylase